MRKPNSRTLVIDASIALASGTTDHPVSRQCRNFLEEVLTICHHAAINDFLHYECFGRPKEKGKNTSKFFRRWYLSMTSRKKIVRISGQENIELRQRINSLNLSGTEKTTLLEDCHLIELALLHDSIVVSKDDEALALYKAIANDAQQIKNVMWANPLTRDLSVWLNEGCKPFQGFELGSKE